MKAQVRCTEEVLADENMAELKPVQQMKLSLKREKRRREGAMRGIRR